MMMNTIKKLIEWYFSKNSLPYWCILLCDIFIIFLSSIFTYWVFRKTQLLLDNHLAVFCTALFYGAIGLIGARIFHTYMGIMRYSSFVDLVNVAYANMLSMVIAIVLSEVLQYSGHATIAALTQTQTVVAFIFAAFGMGAVRVLAKTLYDIAFTDRRAKNVLIYGALSGGVGLAKNIKTQRPRKFRLCGFISHDNRAKHIMLMGKKVYNVNDNLLAIIRKDHIEAILVSHAGCTIFMAHSAQEATIKNGQLTDEDIQGMQIKEVSVEDLLPRDEIEIDMQSVGNLLHDTTILITGSAGSIGSEMVRQIAAYQPKKMILIDQAETPQHDIRLMMKNEFPDIDADTIVTSIDHVTRMDTIFRKYHPDYVFHAAAYKHVPMMEDNPSEAVLNNIHGTKVIADLSVKYGVKKFVMVSTDKAVNPTNVMGCSKRICEIYVQSLNHVQENCQFVTTRFGNVLGSNGSVIPLFREQIKNGGPVTVTDERIVRFFMLIPEACKLVLEAGTKGHGGEIFVFDMGKPVKIVDLAKRMIALSGAKNVQIKFTGLREGEKLYEEVLNELEGTKPTFNKKIRIAQVREYDYNEASQQIDDLIAIAKQYDNMATVAKMKEIVPEYKSNNSIYEELDK